LSNSKALKGKAKRKMITQKMVLSLIDVNDKNGTHERKKSYWNTFYCQSKIYTANGRLYGKYCKNRFCTLCCAIRKAEIINHYLPVIKEWETPYFVTLTVKSYNFHLLPKLMEKVLEGFTKIKDKYRKRNQRGKGIKLVGIKSLECNYNATLKTYNPHLHLIVQDELIADTLIKEWLQLWKSKHASPLGQYKRKVENRERDLIEIVKYGSKIFTEPDVNKKSKLKGNSQVRNIYAAALDNIFKAMQGLRIFERFGFNLPKENPIHATRVTVIKEYDEWVYESKCFDWCNTRTGENLTKFHPLFRLIALLEMNVDTEAE
jgi:hypothetical protein